VSANAITGPDAPEVSGPPGMPASRLLRVRTLWITMVAISSVPIILMTLIYVGSVVDPVEHLHGLPVLVVNEDSGAAVGSQHVSIGSQVVAALDGTPAVSTRLTLDSVTMPEALARLDRNGAYAVIVIPPNLTVSTLALFGVNAGAGPAPSLPTIRPLTNVRAGSLGVSLATGVADPALMAISHAVDPRWRAPFPVLRPPAPASPHSGPTR